MTSMKPEPRFNVKMVFSGNGYLHYKDKTVVPSYLYDGNTYWYDIIFILKRSPDEEQFRKLAIIGPKWAFQVLVTLRHVYWESP